MVIHSKVQRVSGNEVKSEVKEGVVKNLRVAGVDTGRRPIVVVG